MQEGGLSMKKLLISFLIVVIVFSVADARKKKKAGSIEDGVYYDNDYNFSLVIPDGWNSSIKKEESNLRLVLTKEQYDIPTHFTHAPTYTKVPRVIVYIDTLPMRLDWFVDSLLTDEYKSDIKKDMIKELEILYGDYMPKRRTRMSVDSIPGVMISGERRYTVQVQRAGFESDKADVVTDFYGGTVFFTEKNGRLYVFHFICEKRYYDVYEQEFMKLLSGLKFTEG
jgi:hypothetical protein